MQASTGNLSLLWASLLFFVPFASIDAAVSVVLTSATPAPDGNGSFDLFNAPSINSAGQLAFVSQLTDTVGGTTDNVGMFRYNPDSSPSTISRTGQTFNAKPITVFFPPSGYIDSAGTITSMVVVGPPNEFWHTFGTESSLTGMYSAGMPSPSGKSNALLGVTTAVVNDGGLAVYRAVFNGAQPESGLYQRTSGGVHSVRLLQQSTAPRGGTITGVGNRPTINELGQIGTTLTVNTGTAINSAARIDGTTVVELARQGDLIGDGVTTIGQFLTSPSFVNATGQVAFAARYTQPGISAQGVFVADDSGATLVAPGVLPGWGTGTNNVQLMGLSDSGRAALFTEFLGGGFDPMSGIYLTGPGGPSIVAFEDTATPVPGKYFRSFFAESIAVNATGQIAFMAELSDTANGPAAGNGLFLYDPDAGLQQVARAGDELAGSTIASLYFNGSQGPASSYSPDRSLSGLNDEGVVGFAFALANGQNGVAIFSLSAVPGDYTGDGLVTDDDYVRWHQQFGGVASDADGNDDSAVDAADYVVWRKYATASGSGSDSIERTQHAVPECSCLTIITILLAAGAAARRLRLPS